MITLKKYDNEKHIEYVWYENSSQIIYTECDDPADELKSLRVVFKNGACYQYNNIPVDVYLQFRQGMFNNSVGQSLNKYIKGKFDFVKLNNVDLEEIEKRKEEILLSESKKNTIDEIIDKEFQKFISLFEDDNALTERTLYENLKIAYTEAFKTAYKIIKAENNEN